MDKRFVALVQRYKPDATLADIERVLPYCEHKLNQCIERFGEGRRREPKYLAQLVAEEIRSNQYAKKFLAINKERAHRSVLPQNRNLILSENN